MDRSDALLRLPDVDALIALINAGDFDDHLEDLLAAAHGRKRERRGRRRPYGVIELDEGVLSIDTAKTGPLVISETTVAVPVREHVIPGRACG